MISISLRDTSISSYSDLHLAYFWCKDQFGDEEVDHVRRWAYGYTSTDGRAFSSCDMIEFKNADDAILFRLRW